MGAHEKPTGHVLVVEQSQRVFHSVDGALHDPDPAALHLTISACDSYDPDVINAVLPNSGDGLEVVLLVQPPGDVVAIAELAKELSTRRPREACLTVVPNHSPGDGGASGSFSGIDGLLWLAAGASAIVAPMELSWRGTISRLIELHGSQGESGKLLLGSEVVEGLVGVKDFLNEFWDVSVDKKLAWRTAFALSHAAPIPPNTIERWIHFADYLLSRVDWFSYNREDVGRVVSEIGKAWGYSYRPAMFQLAAAARDFGFSDRLPKPEAVAVDDLFDVAIDLDVSRRRTYMMKRGALDELPLSIG